MKIKDVNLVHMKMSKENMISFRIISFFTIAILVKYLASVYPVIFGDVTHISPSCNLYTGENYPHTHFGFRHWLLVCMGFAFGMGFAFYNIKRDNDKFEF